jgi:membrane protease subunit HflC
MRAGLIALVVVIGLAVFGALQSFFITTPVQQALVLQFGEVRQAVREPGLNAKIPFIQDVIFLDKRVLDLNVPAQEIIAADQKRLVVDAFMRYRIVDPVRFYQTVNNVREGQSRLNTFVQSSLRAVLADATFTEIVREERPQLMQRIARQVTDRADDIGVEVVDVRIRRADLPTANSEAIFRRMRTEREQEATEIRAEGQEAARRITAAADRTATVLVAEAQRESEQIRGEGDALRSAIFADAYGRDPDFFAFFRAMQAYEQAMLEGDTRLVLSPNAEFFRYFNNPMGVARAARATVEAETGVDLPAVSPEADTGDVPDAADVSIVDDEGASPRPVAADGADAVTAAGGGEPAGTEVAGEAATDGAVDPMEDPTVIEDTDVTAADEEMSVEEDLATEGAGPDAITEVEDRSPVVEPGLDTEAGLDETGTEADVTEAEAAAAPEEPATEADTRAAIGSEVEIEADEASTAAAIATAEPEPSEAANRAAAGVLGEEDPQTTTVAPVESGSVTIVRPDSATDASSE